MRIEGDFYFTVEESGNYFYKGLYNNFLSDPNGIYHELFHHLSIKLMINEFELAPPLLGHERCKLHLSFFIQNELIGRSTFDFVLEFAKLFFNLRELRFLFVEDLKIMDQGYGGNSYYQNPCRDAIPRSYESIIPILEQSSNNDSMNPTQKIGKNRRITIINEEGD